MWIQTMPVQASLAAGKKGHGTPGQASSAVAGADFAAWLEASLEHVDATRSGTSPAAAEHPAVQVFPEGFSEATFLQMMKEWLAAALQLLLVDRPHEVTDAQANSTVSQDDSSSPAGNSMGALGLQYIPYESLQLLMDVLESANVSLGESEHDALSSLALVQRLLHALEGASDDRRVNDALKQWVQTAFPSAEHGFSADRAELLTSIIKWVRNALASSDGTERVQADLSAQSGQDAKGLTVGALREMLSQLGLRASAGQDGQAGRTHSDNFGMTNPSFSSMPYQAVASTERTFVQWLNEPNATGAAEGNPSSPVRETSPLIPTVRLILSRFETLDGRGYEARFQLVPEQLGTVHVKLVLHQGVLQAQLVVDTRMAKEALESQLHSLQQAFAQQGLQVDKIQVTVREEALFQWQEHNAFLFQEQRQHARQDAQGGQASGSANAYITAETEDSENETATVLRGESSLKEGIDLSV